MFNKFPERLKTKSVNGINTHLHLFSLTFISHYPPLGNYCEKLNIELSHGFRDIYKNDQIKQKVGKEKLPTYFGKEMEKWKR